MLFIRKSSRLNSVNELAHGSYCDAQRTGKIANAQAAVRRLPHALGFVGASQFNHLLLRHLSMLTVIQGTVTAAVVIGVGRLAAVASGHANTLTLTILFIAQAGTVGAALPMMGIITGFAVLAAVFLWPHIARSQWKKEVYSYRSKILSPYKKGLMPCLRTIPYRSAPLR